MATKPLRPNIFKRSWRKINRPTEPWLEKIGIIASIFFAGWAIYLTKQNEDKAQKIEDLEVVIRELKQGNQDLRKLVEQSVRTQLQNSEQIWQNGEQLTRLDGILTALTDQVLISKRNTAPRISGVEGSTIEFISEKEILYIFNYANSGGRTAKNLTYSFASLKV